MDFWSGVARNKKGQFVDGPQEYWVRHGMWGTPVYRTWHNMLQRCNNPNYPSYKHYGAKGISVCERWKTFVNFHDDMGDRPEGMSLIRRNLSGGYNKDNCRWGKRPKQDHSNRKTKITMDDAREIRASLERGTDLAKRYGVTPALICMIRKGRAWIEK